MAAPALPNTGGPRFAPPPPRPSEHRVASAVAGLGASGLLVLLVVLGVAGAGAYGRLVPRAAPAPPERVTFVDAEPRPLPEPAAPAPTLPRPSTALPPIAAPAAPSQRVPATRAPSAAPVAPPTRDTGAVRSTPGVRLPPPPRAQLPGDRIAFPPPPIARPSDGTRAGVATGPLPLDSAGRAERLREISEGVAEAASRRGGGTGGSMGVPAPSGDATRPSPVGGVSLQIGLPGGGPSAAERRRNREADANIQASMSRVRARLDSIRADSVRRADSIRAAGRRPPG